MLCAPAIYRMALYGNTPSLNLLLVVLSSIPLALFLTSIRKWWVFVMLSIPFMYLSGNETFVVVVYRHYMKAINVLSMFITNTTESGSFVSNNLLAVLCDVPVLLLWFVAVYVKRKSKPMSYKVFVSSALLLVAFLVFGRESKLAGLPPYNLPLQYYNAYAINKHIQQASAQSPKKINCWQTDPTERELRVVYRGECGL